MALWHCGTVHCWPMRSIISIELTSTFPVLFLYKIHDAMEDLRCESNPSCIKIPGGRLRKTDVMSFTERPAQSSVNLFLNPCCFGYQILIKLCLDLLKKLAGKKVRYITDSRHNFHIKSRGEHLAVVTLDVNIRI